MPIRNVHARTTPPSIIFVASMALAGEDTSKHPFFIMSTANTSNINNSKVRMPAEWERHAACLILYPHNAATFRDNCVPAQYQVLEVARAIATHGNENVLLFCNSERSANELRAKLTDKDERISVELCPSDDTWARDTGPTFVIQESSNECELVGISWDFNAYGGEKEGCYWPCETDKQVAKRMCQVLSRRLDMTIPTRAVPIVLEGGSIHTDGEGTILTTEECLLNPNRNPRLSKRDIETTVLSALGCTKVIWLPFGLAADDDTNGHVDNLACFSQPGHVVLSWTDDAEGDAENYMRCRRAMEVLEKETDAKGRPLTIHKLHLPPPMVRRN